MVVNEKEKRSLETLAIFMAFWFVKFSISSTDYLRELFNFKYTYIPK